MAVREQIVKLSWQNDHRRTCKPFGELTPDFRRPVNPGH